MQGSVWAALLRQVPEREHNKLMVVTSAGVEITVQGFLRIDHEFVALKGRLAGSQDAGRVYFVPYDQVSYLGFLREVKDAEFEAMFGDFTVPVPATAAAAP